MRGQVTFTFTLRRTLDPAEAPVCRKEATFTFKRETDNRGWRECIPPAATELCADARLYLTVEVRVRDACVLNPPLPHRRGQRRIL